LYTASCVPVIHAPVMPEDGCSIVKTGLFRLLTGK
jgi:hypothetical protein